MEQTYLDGCALGFANIAEQHSLAVAHFDNIKQQFKALLAKPDTRVQLVTQFQQVGSICFKHSGCQTVRAHLLALPDVRV